MIGDHDPEDAYDAGDPIATRLDVLKIGRASCRERVCLVV